ncbi:MAG: insulinase family protein [Pseudomonadota bacterium]
MRQHHGARSFLAWLLVALLLSSSAWPAAAQSDESAATTDPAADAVATAWGFDNSTLAPDPTIRFGVLPNGMRYAIRQNDKPEETAVLELVFDIGSLNEMDDERGIAHFVEHMAFNGTTNVPEGEMVKILERFGLAFGADTNAYTSFDRTGYTLGLPNVSEELIDTALFLLRETASEITFAPGAVERERGVVLSEMRTRDSYTLRNFVEQTDFFLPDTRIAQRLPIGTEESIRTVSADQLKRFYLRHYRPENATLVIVGNIDVDMIERKVIQGFGNWEAQTALPQDQQADIIDFDRTGAAHDFVNPAISESATLVAYAPYRKKPDNLDNRRKALLRSMGYRIIARRIGRMVRAGNTPLLSARFDSGDVFKLTHETQLQVQTRDGELAEGVAVAEKLVRQALVHGFTDQEVAEQIAGYRNALENAVRSSSTRRNAGLANLIIDGLFAHRVVTTPASRLARFEAAEPNISSETILAAMREDIVPLSDPLIHITTKGDIAGGAESIRTAWLGSQEVAVLPIKEKTSGQFAYTDFGQQGAIIEDQYIDDLGIRTIRFANNVRLNIKPTDFEEDRVRISLRIDGGELLNSLDNPYATTLMRIYGDAGLEAHSVDDLLSILAGRSVSLRFSAGSDYFGSYVATTPQDLLIQLQILAAYVQAPGYRTEALERYRRSFDNYYARLAATPEAALGSYIGGIISDDDPRFSLAPQEALEKLDFAALKNAIGESLERASLEIGIVGDVDEQAVIEAVASTFGALPEREKAARDYGAQIQRRFTNERATRYIAHDGEQEQAILRYYWPTDDNSDYATEVRLLLLSEILQLRLTDRVREELGASYSPGASSFMSSIYDGYGYMTVGSNVDFADRETVKQAIAGIVESLITDPASEDELLRAKRPIEERLKQRATSNRSWMAIVDQAQTDPDALARYRSLPDMIASVSAEQLQQEAVKWLSLPPLVVEVVHRSEYAALNGDNDIAGAGGGQSALGAITADNAENE